MSALLSSVADVPLPPVTPVDLLYIVGGLGVLAAAILPRLVRGRAVSSAMAFVGVGIVAGLLPIPLPDLDPVANSKVVERLTEIAVLIAIMGVGLSIDRKLALRSWATTWRLLVIAMPLTVAGIALLGWGLIGLAPASAFLLAAVLSPTDPVLAGDVQLAGPNEGSDDEVRFGLTSEAGLNDGLAFPFVYLAVFVAAGTSVVEWGPRWFAWELVGKVVVGVLVGIAVGWLLGRLSFHVHSKAVSFAEAGEAIVALGAVFLAYGLAETLQGYGFLAVFATAVMARRAEPGHEYHEVLHSFIGQVERLFELVLLLLFGVAIARGLLADLTLGGALTGVAVILLVRPLAGWLSLRGSRAGSGQRGALAFFGVRGIGSFYYLAYAAGEESFRDVDSLWATVGFTVLLSVVVHGALATPAMAAIDKARGEHRPEPGEEDDTQPNISVSARQA